VLKELESEKKPRLHVMNKIDLLEPKQREALRDDAATVHVSGARGVGISTLLERIDQVLEEDPIRRVRLSVPQKEGKILATLAAKARIYSRSYQDGIVEMEAEAPESVLRTMREWVETEE
jgi:50S ribosomal subunit-associated GTPase HflX